MEKRQRWTKAMTALGTLFHQESPWGVTTGPNKALLSHVLFIWLKVPESCQQARILSFNINLISTKTTFTVDDWNPCTIANEYKESIRLYNILHVYIYNIVCTSWIDYLSTVQDLFQSSRISSFFQLNSFTFNSPKKTSSQAKKATSNSTTSRNIPPPGANPANRQCWWYVHSPSERAPTVAINKKKGIDSKGKRYHENISIVTTCYKKLLALRTSSSCKKLCLVDTTKNYPLETHLAIALNQNKQI